jgi:hypothetical protein
MNQCEHCDGFLPDGHDACPNCARPAVRTLVKIVVGAILATTLMACYGGPPHAQVAPNSPTPSSAPASSAGK